ncbi:DUF2189 domain-containing protein [Marinivivus vitaminiproducens]|uniref:DUF2189 domain-containing protein n=1 Tax=Marinivivus vitaminiproducens TaxID=3035935 RepID=UPI0027A114DF|nr:DUF2189 domain-containing protein [Geminicoccaceae bacterium SCSIO 64248]
MAVGGHIRNPIEWSADQLRAGNDAVNRAGSSLHHDDVDAASEPRIRRIAVDDLRDVLRKGVEDFGAYRTDVIFICLIYPLAGLVLARLAFGYDFLPLIFPLASGLALVGPIAAIWLYEMSRRREMGMEASWADALGVLRAPAFGAIFVLGLMLAGIFGLWLIAADAIYQVTLGPEQPASIGAFFSDVLTTAPGWAMIVLGCGVGFLFALVVLSISVVSFPLLLDRDVGLQTAITTSLRAVRENPQPMAAWGMIVAVALVLGSLPAFLGLIVIMPVLGHSTWHLYRKVVVRPGGETSGR